jgi:hypothetical protein
MKMKLFSLFFAFCLMGAASAVAQDNGRTLLVNADFGNRELTWKKLSPFLEPRAANDGYAITQMTSGNTPTLDITASVIQVNREGQPIPGNILANILIDRVGPQITSPMYGSRHTAVRILGSIIDAGLQNARRPEEFDIAFLKVDVGSVLRDSERFTDPDPESDAIIYQINVYYDRWGRVDHLVIVATLDPVTGQATDEMPDQRYLTRSFADFSLKLFTAQRVLRKQFPI